MEDRIIDVYSKGEYPANVLSNFYPNEFIIDGVTCASMEGFLQSLKYKNIKKQRKMCLKVGLDAKTKGHKKFMWRLTGNIYWNSIKIKRCSNDFFNLITKAYEAMFKQNSTFKEALLATKEYKLIHSIGHNNPHKTILTEQEFIIILDNLRYQTNNTYQY